MPVSQLFQRSLNTIGEATRLSWDITKETGASLLTYELYPLGLVGRLPLVRNPLSKGKKLPILFIHGVFHNRAAFAWLAQRFALDGWKHFREVNFFSSLFSIPKLAEKTKEHTLQLIKRYNVPQIDIIAHSMGGILARYFVQLLGGDGLVRHLITLGTPHHGTRLIKYSLLPHLRELGPESRVIRTLNRCAVPGTTQGLSISGDLDVFIQPRRAARWTGVRHIALSRVGHAGLLFSRRVYQVIASRLSEV